MCMDSRYRSGGAYPYSLGGPDRPVSTSFLVVYGRKDANSWVFLAMLVR